MVEEVVNRLIARKETISTMESCSGGALANALTNINGSSKIIKFAAVTYSNDYKVRLGVERSIIEEYSVFSIETAREMAFKISFFAESTYGVGITGKFNSKLDDNIKQKRNKIYVSIYNSKKNNYIDLIIKSPIKRREKCKEYVVKKTLETLLNYFDKQ